MRAVGNEEIRAIDDVHTSSMSVRMNHGVDAQMGVVE